MRTYHKLETALKDKKRVESLWFILDSNYNKEKDTFETLDIPVEIKELVILKKLSIAGGIVETIPEWFQELTSLEELELTCDFRSITALPPNIKKLTLRSKELVNFPIVIEELTQLEELNIEYCENFVSLTESIDKITSLTSLSICRNAIFQLPNTIGNLYNLETLALKENKLTTLPTSIGDLKNLKELYIQKNQIRDLPETIGQLSNLTILCGEVNQLSTLPNSIGNLKQLKDLDVSHNQLKKLPKEIGVLHSLHYLNLRKNQLTTIPKEIGGLTQLYEFDISNNKLTKLPDEIGELISLKDLKGSQNQLATLPTSIQNLTKLSWIAFNQNRLTELPNELSNCTLIYWMDFAQNQLTTIPESFTQLTKVSHCSLDYNQLTEFPSFLLKQKSLSALDINNNHVSFIPPTINQLEKLENIDFSSNPLTITPTSILELPKLYNVRGFAEEVFTHRKTFLKAFATLSPENKTDLYHIIEEKKLDTIPHETFFQALSISFQTLQKNALKHILRNENKMLLETPIQKNCSIAVLGKVNMNKTELKQRLSNLNIHYSPKIIDKTTHVVLEKGAKHYNGFENEKLIFISEQSLHHFLETVDTSHLNQKETAKEDIDNVRQLLLNEDFDNVAIGIELVNSLGMPPTLFTEVFCVANHKECPTSLRNKAKKLVKLHASEKLQEVIKANRGYNLISSPNSSRFEYSFYFSDYTKRLSSFTKDTELDVKKVIHYVCKVNDFAKKNMFAEFLKQHKIN